MTMSSNFTYEWNDSWAEMIQSHTSISAWNHSGMAIKDNDHIVTSDNGESKIITYNIDGEIIDSWTNKKWPYDMLSEIEWLIISYFILY